MTFPEMAVLPKGWDTYDADPPNETAIDNARMMLVGLPKPDCILPDVEGGVGIVFGHQRWVSCDNSGEIYDVVTDGLGGVDVTEVLLT